jgi:hypothetical protein
MSEVFHAKASRLARRKSTSALSYSAGSWAPICTILVGSLVDANRLGVLGRAESTGRSRLVGVGGMLRHRLAKLLELSGVGDGGGELEMLATSGACLLEGAANRDDTVWPRHLQLEVGIVGDRHEFGVAWAPEGWRGTIPQNPLPQRLGSRCRSCYNRRT